MSIINATIWTAYAVLKKDIPLFMTNFFAFFFMSLNMIMYLWARDLIATESIQTLIGFFQVMFPESSDEKDPDLLMGDEGEMTLERDIDIEKEGKETCKEDPKLIESQSFRPTEETRLTMQTSMSIQERKRLSERNPYYYTGPLDLEESKSATFSDHFYLDESAIDYVLKEDGSSVTGAHEPIFNERAAA